MRVTVEKFSEPSVGLENEQDFSYMQDVETVTVDVYQLFLEYLEYLDKQYCEIRKVVIHKDLYRGMTRCDDWQRMVDYGPQMDSSDILFIGIPIEREDLGTQGILDMIIYTDRKVFHSDMIDKDFVEDLDVEELLEATNQKIDERDE